ncbi:MAG: hypothetical protein MMC33_002545 [Icmadophila ericetorum]|nr:hypothetical protein [Icmadophila ericetorum]
MATPNPLENTYPRPSPQVSKKTYNIAGIHCTVFGLEELTLETKNVACLWLLNPRLQTQKCMEPIAHSAIRHWNQHKKQKKEQGHSHLGLIAVSFDQRNHGTREVSPIANEAWKGGNETHAQDMFSIYHGTALDTSQLITYLPSYIFPSPTNTHTLTTHLVLGISLGGHSAWHCILHEPLITAAIVIIGCPDYVRLMSDRARLSKRKSWKESTPPGATFLGSADFPNALVKAVEQYDPAGFFLGSVKARTDENHEHKPSDSEREKLIPRLKSTLGGKRILNLAGGADKLVPYHRSEPFLLWLKRAIGAGGAAAAWFPDGNIYLEDRVFEGVGHASTPEMLDVANRFIVDTLEVGGKKAPVLEGPAKL